MLEKKQNKKSVLIFAIFATVFLMILTINSASAEFWTCFTKGTYIDFCNPAIPDRTAPNDNYKLCMKSYNETAECWTSGNWNVCNAGGGDCTDFGGQIDAEPPELELLSPINGNLYTFRKILLEFNLNEKADVYYLDIINGRGRYSRVCNNCDAGYPAYSRTRSFKEGENHLRFRAEDVIGNEVYHEITFYVDSKKPKVHKTEPRRGYANGEFSIQYTEDTLDYIILNYGNEVVGMRQAELSGCASGKKQWCSINVDLDDYDGQEILYYFTVKDQAGNIVDSRIRKKIKVDTTFPVLNDLNVTVDDNRVYFTLNVTEENLDIIEYIDNNSSRPRWRRMCSRLRDGICEKRITLKDEGGHVINIQIIDEAGNLVGTSVVVNIV